MSRATRRIIFFYQADDPASELEDIQGVTYHFVYNGVTITLVGNTDANIESSRLSTTFTTSADLAQQLRQIWSTAELVTLTTVNRVVSTQSQISNREYIPDPVTTSGYTGAYLPYHAFSSTPKGRFTITDVLGNMITLPRMQEVIADCSRIYFDGQTKKCLTTAPAEDQTNAAGQAAGLFYTTRLGNYGSSAGSAFFNRIGEKTDFYDNTFIVEELYIVDNQMLTITRDGVTEPLSNLYTGFPNYSLMGTSRQYFNNLGQYFGVYEHHFFVYFSDESSETTIGSAPLMSIAQWAGDEKAKNMVLDNAKFDVTLMVNNEPIFPAFYLRDAFGTGMGTTGFGPANLSLISAIGYTGSAFNSAYLETFADDFASFKPAYIRCTGANIDWNMAGAFHEKYVVWLSPPDTLYNNMGNSAHMFIDTIELKCDGDDNVYPKNIFTGNFICNRLNMLEGATVTSAGEVWGLTISPEKFYVKLKTVFDHRPHINGMAEPFPRLAGNYAIAVKHMGPMDPNPNNLAVQYIATPDINTTPKSYVDFVDSQLNPVASDISQEVSFYFSCTQLSEGGANQYWITFSLERMPANTFTMSVYSDSEKPKLRHYLTPSRLAIM